MSPCGFSMFLNQSVSFTTKMRRFPPRCSHRGHSDTADPQHSPSSQLSYHNVCYPSHPPSEAQVRPPPPRFPQPRPPPRSCGLPGALPAPQPRTPEGNGRTARASAALLRTQHRREPLPRAPGSAQSPLEVPGRSPAPRRRAARPGVSPHTHKMAAEPSHRPLVRHSRRLVPLAFQPIRRCRTAAGHRGGANGRERCRGRGEVRFRREGLWEL